MCLTNVKSSKKPYNNKNIRWKVVEKLDDGRLSSIFKPTIWSPGAIKVARKREAGPPYDTGFHVFVTREDARRYRNERTLNNDYGNWVVIKIAVSGFVAAGEWEEYGRSETWTKAKLIECV